MARGTSPLLRRVDGIELPVAGTWNVPGNHATHLVLRAPAPAAARGPRRTGAGGNPRLLRRSRRCPRRRAVRRSRPGHCRIIGMSVRRSTSRPAPSLVLIGGRCAARCSPDGCAALAGDPRLSRGLAARRPRLRLVRAGRHDRSLTPTPLSGGSGSVSISWRTVQQAGSRPATGASTVTVHSGRRRRRVARHDPGDSRPRCSSGSAAW